MVTRRRSEVQAGLNRTAERVAGKDGSPARPVNVIGLVSLVSHVRISHITNIHILYKPITTYINLHILLTVLHLITRPIHITTDSIISNIKLHAQSDSLSPPTARPPLPLSRPHHSPQYTLINPDYYGKLALTWPPGYCEQQLALGKNCDPTLLSQWNGYSTTNAGTVLPFTGSGPTSKATQPSECSP